MRMPWRVHRHADLPGDLQRHLSDRAGRQAPGTEPTIRVNRRARPATPLQSSDITDQPQLHQTRLIRPSPLRQRRDDRQPLWLKGETHDQERAKRRLTQCERRSNRQPFAKVTGARSRS